MKIKLIIVFALTAVLLILLAVPGSADRVSQGDSGLNLGSGSQTSKDIAEPLPVATREWYFELLTDVTGANEGAGDAAAWGFDYGVKAINETGGVRGVSVRWAVRDTASDQAKAASEMTTVVESTDPKVLLVFGPIEPFEYKAAAPAFSSAHIPAIGNADGDTLQNFAGYAISIAAAPGETAGKAVSSWISHDSSIQKVALIYDSSVGSLRDNAERAKAVITEAGLSVAVTVEASGDTFDAAGVAGAAYGTDADAYYIDLTGDGNKRVVEQLVYMNGDVAPSVLMGSLDASVVQLPEIAALNSEKVYIWSEFDPEADAEKRLLFDTAFDAAIGNGRYYNIAADYCQAASFVCQAVEELGLTGDPARAAEERDQLSAYMRDCAQVSTPLGVYSTSGGAKIATSRLFQIKDGKFVNIP
ncbi:hypothetical protein AGMMS49983_21000 [Clostridia bacterium]|nr:hypothetical protein AGMMS49983_21000 [Clostridia bacterium]